MQPSANLPTRARPLGIRAGTSGFRNGGASAASDPNQPQFASPVQRANRRKLRIFVGVFALAGAASLIYTFARPAEYRATARVQINPGAVQVESLKPAGGSQGEDAPRPFLTELQVLTSRPVLEAAAKKLSAIPGNRMAALGPDPVTAMQSSLALSPAGGTDVVELAATGPDPDLVADVVNGVIATYRERLEQAYQETTNESLAQIDDEVAKLEAKVSAQRRFLEDFRLRHNVVSMEREENQVLARVRGQAAALNNANEKLAAAEGKLRSLSEAAAAGRSIVRARDNPTLANLEQRASQLREDLSELERNFMPGYLAADSRVREKRARLADLEQQIVSKRQESQQASLAEAQEEVASARETAKRIQQQMADDRIAVQAFTARFNEHKALQDDLTQLESLYRDTMQRKVKLEAGERARRPFVEVVEAATVPQQPWRPFYLRDAAISVVGSFLLALLVMWVVEIFNRSDPQPTLLVPQPMPYPSPGGQFAERPTLAGYAMPALEASPSGLLAAAPPLPRELGAEEISGLLAAATPDVRLASVLLLSGLSPEEVIALQWDDVDLATRQIRVGGDSPRAVEIFEPVASLLVRSSGTPGTRVLPASGTVPSTVEHLTSDVLYAAHDAGIDRPAEVTPAALRHTYLAFLARQGIRLADLTRLVGRLAPDEAATYSGYSPPGKRLALTEVDRVMAGVREAGLETP